MVRRRLEMASVKKEGRFPEAAKARESEAVEPQVAAVVSEALHFLSSQDPRPPRMFTSPTPWVRVRPSELDSVLYASSQRERGYLDEE